MREGWEYKKLGEIATFINGYPFKPSDWKDSGRKIIRIQNLNNPDAVYNYYDGDIENKYIVTKGDVLISWSGSLGVFEWSYDEAILNQHIFKVVFNKGEINKRFFEYVVSSRINEMKTKVHGITMQHITKRDFDVIPVPVPDLLEQQRIVSELDLLSSIIEKKKAQLKEYDQLAQSIFYDMFGDPIENPKGWEVKKMGDVCAQKTKIARASKNFTSKSPIEYIDISSIDNISKTITTTTSYIFSEAPSRAQQIVEYGDILISLVRPNLQNIAIVLYNKNNLVGSSGFCVIRTEQQTNKEYLFYVILSSHFTDFLMQRVSGANYPAVREEDVKSYTLPIPPISLQQQFASKIEAIERQKALIQQSITETETLFNSRMDYYFN